LDIRWSKQDIILTLLIFVAVLIVYNLTLTPSLSYQSPDGNELATIPYILGLAHSTGYPLYTWLGKLFTFIPLGDVAHRVNLMSAVMGAGAVALLYLVVVDVTGSRLASAFAALAFGFSRTFWSQAVIAEVYAPNAFMMALTVLLLLAWARKRSYACFLAFALTFGLSLGTHMSDLGFAPAFVLFILLVDWRILKSPRHILGGLGMFALGCLQFLWLPYRASTLTDALMLREAPTTLQGIYRYTLGAFPQFKFAFPLPAIPDRIVLYLELLRRNFGLAGMVLGLGGMWGMLIRDTKRFYLFITMYLVHVVFFIQYKAFDIDVFFIPAHWVYAVFMGYGVFVILSLALALLRRKESLFRLGAISLHVLMAIALAWLVARELGVNWKLNDRSGDTAINDFYQNVFEILPEGSVLLGRGGVFGYDMFYFRLVYGVRPDVLMPHLASGGRHVRPSPEELAGREVYTTVRLDTPRGRKGPWAPPPGFAEPGSWLIPVLVGQNEGRRELVLYRVSREPPQLVVREASPSHRTELAMDGLVLVGYDLDENEVRRGGRVHVTFYWRVQRPRRFLVATFLGDEPLEVHELGFGNLPRYVKEHRPPREGVVVEDYFLVIPSDLPPGEHALRMGLVTSFAPPARMWEVLKLVVR